MSYDVSVFGLGRVGLPLALCFADTGLRVLGVDKDADRLARVREGRMPFREPGTQGLLARVGESGTLEGSALSAIEERAAADCLVVDPWNAMGTGQVFGYATELAALRPAPSAG